jgi:hypothetical protein
MMSLSALNYIVRILTEVLGLKSLHYTSKGMMLLDRKILTRYKVDD